MAPNTPIKYESTRHAKFALSYHFIWCPKYRHPILTREDIVTTTKEAIAARVEGIGCTLIALEVMPDHIHLSITAPPRYSPATLAGKIKGGVGSTLAAKYPELKKKGHIVSFR